MAVRVLLALADDPAPLADPLRAAGHALEACPPGRLRETAAVFRPAACVVEVSGTRLPAALDALVTTGDGPAVVALLGPSASDLAPAALERGVDAVLPREAQPEWVVAAVRSAIARRATRAELGARREAVLGADAVVLLGGSSAARRLRESLERVASTPRTTVLVSADPGGGADALARLVHARSARAEGPLVELHAGARPDADEAEDLGPGSVLTVRAEGGTLVVHQVARLGPLAQLALARFLERRGEEAGEADVRVVATTTLDLAPLVQGGRFREDLLYRINVLTLRVPTLAERREDIDALARGLLERVGGRASPHRLAPDALDSLRGRSWAGGLHQLRLTLDLALRRSPTGVLEGAGIAAAAGAQEPGGEVGAGPEGLGGPGALLRLPDRSLRSAEEALIRQVLVETGGNKLRSAEILGIHRTTLYHKLRDYGIEA